MLNSVGSVRFLHGIYPLEHALYGLMAIIAVPLSYGNSSTASAGWLSRLYHFNMETVWLPLPGGYLNCTMETAM